MKKKIVLTSIIVAVVASIIIIVLLNVINTKKEEAIVKGNDEILSQVENDTSNFISNEIVNSNISNELEENIIEGDTAKEDEKQESKENIDIKENADTDSEEIIKDNQSKEFAENRVEEIVPEVEYIQGMEVAGHIEISKFNVDAPIFRNVTLKSLEISVGVAYGNLNDIGNTTIFGHAYNNYPFEKLSQLENGDTIIITDSNKNEITYEVYDKKIVNSNDATYMIRNTNGTREITMQTGNSDTTKLIVLAREINQ